MGVWVYGFCIFMLKLCTLLHVICTYHIRTILVKRCEVSLKAFESPQEPVLETKRHWIY